jgi:hypothetical protein
MITFLGEGVGGGLGSAPLRQFRLRLKQRYAKPEDSSWVIGAAEDI